MPEDEKEKNELTIYVRTSSGKTICIKCAKKQKATSILDEVERRSAILRGMTYLVRHGEVLNEKRTIEENNTGTETTIEMSLTLLGGTDNSESMDTLESEEDRDKKRKLAEVSEGKLTRESEDALFLKKEIIDTLKKSEATNEEQMEKFLQKISDSVGAHLHGMNSSIVKMKEEGDDRYKQISERFTIWRRKSLTWTKNTKT